MSGGRQRSALFSPPAAQPVELVEQGSCDQVAAASVRHVCAYTPCLSQVAATLKTVQRQSVAAMAAAASTNPTPTGSGQRSCCFHSCNKTSVNAAASTEQARIQHTAFILPECILPECSACAMDVPSRRSKPWTFQADWQHFTCLDRSAPLSFCSRLSRTMLSITSKAAAGTPLLPKRE